MSNLTQDVQRRLHAAGLSNAKEMHRQSGSIEFGDAAVVFILGPLMLRFTRERGQEFLDLAASVEPTVFHQFDDVEIAFGWKTIEDILAKRDPEDIEAVLARVSANLGTLKEAFSGDRERLTRARVERAARERGQAFTARLRGDH